MIEKELKILLTKEQFVCLVKQFEWDQIRTQVNYYYTDNNNYIKNSGITIRVRECNNTIALQLKVPVSEQGAIHMKQEIETFINEIPQKIDGDFLSKLCSVSLPDVSLAGFMVTERYIYKWSNDIEICLDKNKYLDVEDYEIEIEYKGNIDESIFDFLNKNNIEIKDDVKGKCGRFFSHLLKGEEQ